jgi:hypothetical protein
MGNDVDDAILSAYFGNVGLQRAEAYLKRGRHLAETPTGQLKERWVTLFKTCVECAMNQQREARDSELEREDIEAELLIRKDGPPYELVGKETKDLQVATKLAVAELQRNPARLQQVAEELAEDISEFLDDPNKRAN